MQATRPPRPALLLTAATCHPGLRRRLGWSAWANHTPPPLPAAARGWVLSSAAAKLVLRTPTFSLFCSACLVLAVTVVLAAAALLPSPPAIHPCPCSLPLPPPLPDIPAMSTHLFLSGFPLRSCHTLSSVLTALLPLSSSLSPLHSRRISARSKRALLPAASSLPLCLCRASLAWSCSGRRRRGVPERRAVAPTPAASLSAALPHTIPPPALV